MPGKTITRADLSEAVYQEVGLSRNESADLVESVLSEIADALTKVLVQTGDANASYFSRFGAIAL